MSVIVPKEDVVRFCKEAMIAVNCKDSHSCQLAEVLMTADYRGHFSHGLNRIAMYVDEISSGASTSLDEPFVTSDANSVAHVDGNNCLGAVVGNFCMQLAIEKAKQFGVGWISCNNSNHFGIAGWYALQACNQGLIGLSFTNSSPFMYPTRSRKAALGTNPIALAAPAEQEDDCYVLDMATTAVAVGKLEMSRRKNESIPYGWAVDEHGKVTEDPFEAQEGGLLPLGGSELTSGYKGFGLGMLVEIFCGILGGAAYGPLIRKWGDNEKVANLGHCFAAINPDDFLPGFKQRMSHLVSLMRGLPRADDDVPILIPGDKERNHMKMCNNLGGIPYTPVLIESMNQLADKLKISRLKAISK